MKNLTTAQTKALALLKKVGGSVKRSEKGRTRLDFYKGKFCLTPGGFKADWQFPGFNTKVMDNLVEKGYVNRIVIEYKERDYSVMRELEADQAYLKKAHRAPKSWSEDRLDFGFKGEWEYVLVEEEVAAKG